MVQSTSSRTQSAPLPPRQPVFAELRRASKRKRTLHPDNTRDVVEIACVYALELFASSNSFATTMPALPKGVSDVTELTGRSLAMYMVQAARGISIAQREQIDIFRGMGYGDTVDAFLDMFQTSWAV